MNASLRLRPVELRSSPATSSLSSAWTATADVIGSEPGWYTGGKIGV
jgi:hypothetical protein